MAIGLAELEARRLISGTGASLVSEKEGCYSHTFSLPNGMKVSEAFRLVIKHVLPKGLVWRSGTAIGTCQTSRDRYQFGGTYDLPNRTEPLQDYFPAIVVRHSEMIQRASQRMRTSGTCPVFTQELLLNGQCSLTKSELNAFTVHGFSVDQKVTMGFDYYPDGLPKTQLTALDLWWVGVRRKIAQGQLRVINHAS